jgi:hypothetical protein
MQRYVIFILMYHRHRLLDLVTEDTLVHFIMPEEMNHRQFKDFSSNTESEYEVRVFSAIRRFVG